MPFISTLKFTKCLYAISVDLCTKQLKPYRKYIFYFNFALFIYAIPRLLTLIYINFTVDKFRIRQYDYIGNYLKENAASYDKYFPVLIWMLEILLFFIQFTMYKLPTTSLMCSLLSQFIIKQQDLYHHLHFPKHKLEEMYKGKLKKILKTVQRKNIWVKLYYMIKIRVVAFYKMENINRRAFNRSRIPILPKMSLRLRKEMVLLSLLGNWAGLATQLLGGTFCLTLIVGSGV